MSALVRAELLKVHRGRIFAAMLVATLVMVAVTAAVSVPSVTAPNGALSLDDPALLARVIGIAFEVPEVTMVLLGVLAFTQEVRYGTITATFLVEPRRSRVLVAKGGAVVLASAAITAVALVVSSLTTVAFIRARHVDVTGGAELAHVVAAVFVVMALYGLIGLAFGALVENQIIAVVAALVWMLAVEHLLFDGLPSVGRWTPLGASYGFLELGRAVTTSGTLLDPPIAGLLLAGYTGTAIALALLLAPRRDVL